MQIDAHPLREAQQEVDRPAAVGLISSVDDTHEGTLGLREPTEELRYESERLLLVGCAKRVRYLRSSVKPRDNLGDECSDWSEGSCKGCGTPYELPSPLKPAPEEIRFVAT